jgi:hypothetical protein
LISGLFSFRTLPCNVALLAAVVAVHSCLPRVVSFSLSKHSSFFNPHSSVLLALSPSRRWLVCIKDAEYSLRTPGVSTCPRHKVLLHASFQVIVLCSLAPFSISAARNFSHTVFFLLSIPQQLRCLSPILLLRVLASAGWENE